MATATIQNFKAALGTGGARPNQFGINIPGLDANKMLLASGASLPSFNMGTVPVPYRGRTVNFAGEKTFDPWTVTFQNDNEFSNRAYFEKWHYDIANNDTIGGRLRDYFKDLNVWQFDRNADTILRSYKFVNAFPSNVSEIALDYAQGDSIETFSVTFTYDYFTFATGDYPVVKSTQDYGVPVGF
jgi:hypothetical protein